MPKEQVTAAVCRECGECLRRCVYLRLPRAEAVAEVKRLNAGLPASHIDRHCTSCAACDLFCPYGAAPYRRILERLRAGYLRHGLPERARYFMPTESRNFRTDVLTRLPQDERRLVEQWRRNEPAGQVLYPGCNLITSAYLTMSGVLDDLTIAGGLADCCGEMYYRFGMLDLVKRFAEKHTLAYRDQPIERMVFVCPAGLNMFRNIMTKQFGAEFNFPLVFIADYLHELFDAGRLAVVNPLRGKIVVHDSCHGRLLGDPLMDSVRRLLTRLGLTVVEARYTRENGLCCGIAAGAPRQALGDLARAVGRATYEYALSDGESVAAYCTGCYLTLATVPAASSLGKPVRHLLDLVAEAIGRPVADRLGSRARLLLQGIARHAVPAYLSPKRFWMG